MLLRGVKCTSLAITQLYLRFKHIFNPTMGWDPRASPSKGERLLRCPGSVKVAGDTRVLLPIGYDSWPLHTPIKFYLVQYLTGAEVPILPTLLLSSETPGLRSNPASAPPSTRQRTLQPSHDSSVQAYNSIVVALEATSISESTLLRAIEQIVGEPC